MEALVFEIMMTLQGLFWGGMLVALVYFGYRRYKIKQEEDFEDRDN